MPADRPRGRLSPDGQAALRQPAHAASPVDAAAFPARIRVLLLERPVRAGARPTTTNGAGP